MSPFSLTTLNYNNRKAPKKQTVFISCAPINCPKILIQNLMILLKLQQRYSVLDVSNHARTDGGIIFEK
jgi:hypothetical protein